MFDILDEVKETSNLKNQKKYWFRAKKWGWGWYPSSWHGWLVLAVYIVVLVHDFFRIDISQHSEGETVINFLPRILLYTFILILICLIKGEPLKFRK